MIIIPEKLKKVGIMAKENSRWIMELLMRDHLLRDISMVRANYYILM